MTNRILREGLLDSDAVGAVSIGAEVLFVRLMLLADDYGRYDGRVSVICRRAFVNRRSVDEQATGEWLTELDRAELIRLYEVGGKPFLLIVNFRQRTRSNASKYPAPDGCFEQNQELSNRIDGQPSDSGASGVRPPRTYSYSDSESKTRDTPLPPCPDGKGESGSDAPGDSAPASCLQPDGDAAQRRRRRRAVAPSTGIKAWLVGCAERGEKPVPEGSAPMLYAQQAGIPPEILALHWREFKRRHVEADKRYSDWPRVLLNSLRGNWYGFWLIHGDGTCRLSTKGLQAQRVEVAMHGAPQDAGQSSGAAA